VNLLVFGIETAVTTLTCLVEMLSWQGYTNEELGRLCSLYVPYLVVGKVSSPFICL
jgi:EXPERA (EXPanded EBP superfamily)